MEQEKERLDEQTMALRAVKEFQDGMVVNLGVGIPTLCSMYVPPEKSMLNWIGRTRSATVKINVMMTGTAIRYRYLRCFTGQVMSIV